VTLYLVRDRESGILMLSDGPRGSQTEQKKFGRPQRHIRSLARSAVYSLSLCTRDIHRSTSSDYLYSQPRGCKLQLYCISINSAVVSTMAGRGNPGGGRKTLLAPIHFIFKLLQQRSTVSIWLYEQLAFRIEGKIRVR